MKIEHEKIAAAYIRVSTEEQTELSPDSQLKEIRKYAEAHGFELLEEHIYVDAGISGRSTVKRSEFNRMIGAAKAKPKPFDVILLWKFSRFARNREDSIVYKSILRKNGIEVVSISENLGDDKTSILIEAIIEAMDEYYSINLAGEVKRGMREKVERGGIVSIPSYGYIVKDGNYVIDEEKADIVRSIFNDYFKGCSIRTLAIRLNNAGILTSRGVRWESRTVEYVLQNPVYIGKIRWNPERHTNKNYGDKDLIIVEGTHQPIIDETLFYKVQERLAHMRKTYRKGEHRKKPAFDFMLRGLVNCSNCGKTLMRTAGGKKLQCNGYLHGKCSISHCITIQIITESVLERIKEDINIDDFIIIPNVVQNPESENVENQIELLKKKLIRAMDAYENGAYELEEYKNRKFKILNDITKLESKLNKLPILQDNIERKSNVEKGLTILTDDNVSETSKNIVLRQIVEKIVFDRKNNEISVYYY